MTPTQAESIARDRLPCTCGADKHSPPEIAQHRHRASCPAHYRPAVARALVEAVTLDRDEIVKAIKAGLGIGNGWYQYFRVHHKDGMPVVQFSAESAVDKIADAILSSNKTRVEGEG